MSTQGSVAPASGRLSDVWIWAARVVAGAAFLLSGWAKSVDPWGFVYKIEEYLGVWGIPEVFPREIIVVGAVGLSIFEFVTGMLLITGSLRRTAPVFAAAMMAVMLPLTVYIAVADPVSDCGCFGDLWVVSNTVTLLKNIVLSAIIVLLLAYNGRVSPGVRPSLQWIAIALSLVYTLILSFVGWQFQPIVDFRPYPVGSEIQGGYEEAEVSYIYERGGERREFGLAGLPDSTWTYVGMARGAETEEALAIFVGDDEVTADVLDDGGEDDDLLMLVVSEPGLDYLTRARYANELSHYMDTRGGRMVGVVAASGDALDRWADLARPDFPVYSSSDTSLKQLVRGSTALVRVQGGLITLKRNFATFPPDVLAREGGLDSVVIVDDGALAWRLTLGYVLAILILWVLGAWYGKKACAVNPNPSDECC